MPTPLDPDCHFGALLHDVGRIMRRYFDRKIRSLGLTQTQWRALIQLCRTEGLNQVQLAELLEVQPITLARLIDKLEAAGWVERRADPRDRRAFLLYVTTKAQPLLDEIWAKAAESMDVAMVGVSDAEHQQLMSTLQRIKHNLLNAEAEPVGDDIPLKKSISK